MSKIRFAASLIVLVAFAFAATASRSVWDGVYSKPQATRGEKAYSSQCARCHGEALLGGENSPPLADKDFLEKWYGKPVSNLVELTRTQMPSDGPGKLSRRVCTDIIAYVLSANGFPAGEGELDSGEGILIQPKP